MLTNASFNLKPHTILTIEKIMQCDIDGMLESNIYQNTG